MQSCYSEFILNSGFASELCCNCLKLGFFYTSLMLKPAAASPCPGDSTMVWALCSVSGLKKVIFFSVA